MWKKKPNKKEIILFYKMNKFYKWNMHFEWDHIFSSLIATLLHQLQILTYTYMIYIEI